MTGIKKRSSLTGLETAVIGMTGRFPAAANLDEFWENLKNGKESICFFSGQELTGAGVDPKMVDIPQYVRAKGVLEEIEYFDSAFFNYTPKEAEMMDPQVRLFHQCAWQTLEDAGYDPGTYPGVIGLYAGYTPNIFWRVGNLLRGGSFSEQFESGNLNSHFFTTLICYKLNLKGPGITINTACSTALTAIHMACRALLTGEADMVLAGGVTVTLPWKSGYIYQEGMINSPDGHCRAFDANANGIVGGNGIGIVLLKRLVKALADNDHIYAVIKGPAVNNDGSRKPGYAAPSVAAQAEVIRSGLRMAEIQPEQVTYIETHGTGTPLGDPIEIEALKKVFTPTNSSPQKKHTCAIGSVKTNIGHLDAAAGAAGFIKTVLALKHHLIPPTLHFEKANPVIDFTNSPFVVNNRLAEWKHDDQPRCAAVSAFGIGGTNAHVILEEFPEGTGELPPLSTQQYQLILLSAQTPTALEKMTENLAEYLKTSLLNPGNPSNPTNPGPTLADVAYTLQVGRKPMAYRRSFIIPGPPQDSRLFRRRRK
jgi:acyl transferase domain-containing protein